MSFIVWWGSSTDSVPRGIVVDACIQCGEFRAFQVADHFHRSHLYGLTIGAGSWVGATRACFHCCVEFEVVADRYARVLPLGAARSMTLDDGLAACLPNLAKARSILTQLEKAEHSAAYRHPDAAHLREVLPEARQALGRLLHLGFDVLPIAQKLVDWQHSSEAELREAVAELRGIARGAGLQ